MSTLLPIDLDARRRDTAPGTSLGALADALAAELEPLLARPLPIPERKARLTRAGGRCPVHGTLLTFDPWAPHAHRCEVCGTVYTGDEHDAWWAMGAQLWVAERAVHAAALHQLRGDPRHRALALHILRELAARYASWPNRDNVLGPTRPFFSTYLESIWILNLCHALAHLERDGRVEGGDVVRAQLLEPSRALIAGFDEGASNRQVWNDVAILSASHLLDDRRTIDRRLERPGSVPWFVTHALLGDGTWYEGENYHLFAHRGLWYGVQLLRALGRPLVPDLEARFHEGFAAPFAGLLPDDTLPSRRDSQYAVSVRQWRFAEWCELGYAMRADARLAGLLTRLYDGTPSRTTDARARSTADAERNESAARLSRADLSWRALLMANATRPEAPAWHPSSVLLPSQGLAVLRRDAGRAYAALEGGATGGGHGHPDRLALTLQVGDTRILDDPGTGSYMERTLHWYRSTLAHYAPLVDGASQARHPAVLEAWEERGGAGWVRKRATLARGVEAVRTLVVADGYLVDHLAWQADRDVTLTLPLAPVHEVPGVGPWAPASRAGAGGLEDGFEFLTKCEAAVLPEGMPVQCEHPGANTSARAHAWYAASHAATLVRGIAPGAPGHDPAPRLLLEVAAARGAVTGVWSWTTAGAQGLPVRDVTLTPLHEVVAQVVTDDGTIAAHGPAPHGWHIALTARHARSSIDLEGLREAPAVDGPDAAPSPAPTRAPLAIPAIIVGDDALRTLDVPLAGALRLELGATDYVRTEHTWDEAGRPRATVLLGATTRQIVMRVTARTGLVIVPRVAPDDADPWRMPENPLDNERADVNADGLQWYVTRDFTRWEAAALVVPVAPDRVRATPLVASAYEPRYAVRWLPDDAGWELQVVLPREAFGNPEGGPVGLALVVNERPRDRERRRGQLVLGGGGDGFGYLRGDRWDPARAIPVHLPAVEGIAHGGR